MIRSATHWLCAFLLMISFVNTKGLAFLCVHDSESSHVELHTPQTREIISEENCHISPQSLLPSFTSADCTDISLLDAALDFQTDLTRIKIPQLPLFSSAIYSSTPAFIHPASCIPETSANCRRLPLCMPSGNRLAEKCVYRL